VPGGGVYVRVEFGGKDRQAQTGAYVPP
jgi:hypothetical protein